MYHEKSAEEALRLLQSSEKAGLTEEEAQKRLEAFGENRIADGEGTDSFFKKLIHQFMDFMVVLLLCAAAISFVVSFLQGEKDYIDSIIILAIVFVNAILGVIQESKAEKAIAALKALSAPKATVLRDGSVKELDASLVVPGDILVLEAGDFVPADARLIQGEGLQVEESALTGESVPSDKEAKQIYPEKCPVGDRKNMVFCSTCILRGHGRAVVTATGMQTEMGSIADLMQSQEREETPLQKRLSQTGKTLGLGALGICALIFLLGVLRKIPPFSMFMTAISLAVAAIPEGLTAIVTIVLAMGMQRMSRRGAIIRRLTAVETLGGAQVICSDKTGTLTQNKMQVVAFADGGNQNLKDEEKRKFLGFLAALCNDAREEGRTFIGEPTETALAEAALQLGQNKVELDRSLLRVGEIPFSSEQKRMTTVHKLPEGTYLVVMKGAPERVLACCGLSPSAQKKAQEVNETLAASALRVIALAWKELNSYPAGDLESGLTLAGFLGLMDPPRPEVREAVAICKKAGIRPVMITGDHVLTARAIGAELGIFHHGDICLSGEELDAMEEDALSDIIPKVSVFARVSPAHKVRIVKAFQAKQNVVAMTGDGVNDAPALKAADIGCAMGLGGTDVAKAAADMILTDDNFATIVAAVREGRGIYANIQKAVHFLLSSNIGEILTIFMAMLFGWATPLLPIQLLWVNLVTDSLPAIALGFEPTQADVMERPPHPAGKSLFSGGLGQRIALEGAMIGMLSLLAFGIGHLYFDAPGSHAIGRTMAFAVLSLSQLVHAFNMRSNKSVFHMRLKDNPFLVGAFVVGLILQCTVIMLPSVATLFKVIPLGLREWATVAVLSFMPLLIVELEKLFSPME